MSNHNSRVGTLDDEYREFYQKINRKCEAWIEEYGEQHHLADQLLCAPDLFLLLCELSMDKEVPAQKKANLATAISYFILPHDLVPEGVVGPVGLIDDVALAAFVLRDILKDVDENVVRRHWSGEGDVQEVIQDILTVARGLDERFLGKLTDVL